MFWIELKPRNVLAALFIFGLAHGALAMERVIQTQAVTVVTEYPGGVREINRGLGFTVGRLFYTTRHSIPTAGNTSVFVGNHQLKPRRFDDAADLAVFEIPDSLCQEICNHGRRRLHNPDIDRVAWLEPGHGRLREASATVMEQVYFDDPTRGNACDANVVITVDRPILPGTSGAPVFDSKTGLLVGMAQGSFANARGSYGYFKPIHCVVGGSAGS